jgi:hypothetical protein
VLGDHIDRVDTTQTLTDLRRFDARAMCFVTVSELLAQR